MNEAQMSDPRARLRAAVSSVTAPPRLEARIRSEIRESHKGFWMRQMVPAAAALVVGLGVVIAYQLGHLRLTSKSQEAYIGAISGRVAGLMRVGLGDHVHCSVFRKFPANPPSVESMEETLGPDYKDLLPIMEKNVPGNLRVVMAHQCSYHGRKFVHLALSGDSRLLSLVISRKRVGETFTAEKLAPVLADSGIPIYQSEVQRFEIAGFESQNHLVYVVSDLPQQKNVEIMTALAAPVRDLLNRVKL